MMAALWPRIGRGGRPACAKCAANAQLTPKPVTSTVSSSCSGACDPMAAGSIHAVSRCFAPGSLQDREPGQRRGGHGGYITARRLYTVWGISNGGVGGMRWKTATRAEALEKLSHPHGSQCILSCISRTNKLSLATLSDGCSIDGEFEAGISKRRCSGRLCHLLPRSHARRGIDRNALKPTHVRSHSEDPLLSTRIISSSYESMTYTSAVQYRSVPFSAISIPP